MQVGDKVVCTDQGGGNGSQLGGIYTIIRIDKRSWDTFFYFKELDVGFYNYRFRLLEEIQNTNFIGLVQ